MSLTPYPLARLARAWPLASLLVACLACEDAAVDPNSQIVASVEVTPRVASVSTGDTLRFTAVPRNEVGEVLAADSITWQSTNNTVATVTPTGTATGVFSGAATIRAHVAGVLGDATLSVSAPPTSTGFANRPSNFVTRGEWNNATTIDADGWYDDGNPSGWGGKTVVNTGYAGSPRIGGSRAIQTLYAGGVEGGHDAGRMQFNLPAGTNEIFFGAEVQFKSDYPTSTSSGGNKQFFVTFSGGGRYFVNIDDGAARGRWGIYVGSSPLIDSNIQVVYGQWIKMEWYLKRNTGAGDGIMRLWIDGVLAVNLTNLSFPTGNMVLAYDDGSNNGNHYPGPSDPRKIGSNLGGPVDAYRWASVLHVATPP
ncbi:MAG: Ig-like domain-containing protein [Gemmatimonadaceae bacterium]|nr:Ig-like domain-containing protein [Gemmatimonadaceae bacterium]